MQMLTETVVVEAEQALVTMGAQLFVSAVKNEVDEIENRGRVPGELPIDQLNMSWCFALFLERSSYVIEFTLLLHFISCVYLHLRRI